MKFRARDIYLKNRYDDACLDIKLDEKNLKTVKMTELPANPDPVMVQMLGLCENNEMSEGDM